MVVFRFAQGNSAAFDSGGSGFADSTNADGRSGVMMLLKPDWLPRGFGCSQFDDYKRTGLLHEKRTRREQIGG